MGSIGTAEILVVLVAALLILGPQKLPQAARQMGKAMAEFRRMTSGFQSDIKEAFTELDHPEPPRYQPPSIEPGPIESAPIEPAPYEAAPYESRPYETAAHAPAQHPAANEPPRMEPPAVGIPDEPPAAYTPPAAPRNAGTEVAPDDSSYS